VIFEACRPRNFTFGQGIAGRSNQVLPRYDGRAAGAGGEGQVSPEEDLAALFHQHRNSDPAFSQDSEFLWGGLFFVIQYRPRPPAGQRRIQPEKKHQKDRNI
jgi:hypothetical protein